MELNDIFRENIESYSFLSNIYESELGVDSFEDSNIKKDLSTKLETTKDSSNSFNNLKLRNQHKNKKWEDIVDKGIIYNYDDNPILYRKIRKNIQNRSSSKKMKEIKNLKNMNNKILINNLKNENVLLIKENTGLKKENVLIKAQIEFLESNIMKRINNDKNEVIIEMDSSEQSKIVREKDSSISNKVRYLILLIFTKILIVSSYNDYNTTTTYSNDLKSFTDSNFDIFYFFSGFIIKFMIYILLVILLFLIK